MSDAPKVGTIGWVDLTVPDAVRLKEFYSSVVGWGTDPVDMGGYEDFCMVPPEGGAPAAGVCHARGSNEGLPPVWLVYLTVADLDASVAKVEELGGSVLVPAKSMGGYGRYCVIKDPAGAVAALYEPAAATAAS